MICMLACCWCIGSPREKLSLCLSLAITLSCLTFCPWPVGSFLFPFLFIPFSLILSCLQSPVLSSLFPFYLLFLLVLSSAVPRGPLEPAGGHGEMERSGGPHSDSGSISPTWERDRRGPPTGPPGHLGPPGACVCVCMYCMCKRNKEKDMQSISEVSLHYGKAIIKLVSA